MKPNRFNQLAAPLLGGSRILVRGFGTKSIREVTSNNKLISWVEEKQKLLKPDAVRILDGSEKVSLFFPHSTLSFFLFFLN